MVKLRLISDVHYTKGINFETFEETFGKELEKEKDCITLIAGDLAESYSQAKLFLEKVFTNQEVFFVAGNHDGVYNTEGNTLAEYKALMVKEFPKTHGFWHFLENDWAFIPGTNTEVAVIGSTFYTDYEYCNFTIDDYNNKEKAWNLWMQAYGLNVEPIKEEAKLTKKLIRKYNMDYALTYLNDFKWGYETKTKKLYPEYYLSLHKLAKQKVIDCYNEIIKINPNCKVILMTHHCLSDKCIAESFKNAKLNASYVSDLEKWLCKSMPNLKLVLSGHVHNRNDFYFGKDNKRYILNPCGYLYRDEHLTEKAFNPNLIINTEEL